MEKVFFAPDKRRQTDLQLFADLNKTLKAAKKRIGLYVREPKRGYYNQTIYIYYPLRGKRQQKTLFAAFEIFGIARRDIMPMLFEEKSKADKETNQTTINQLYTAVFELAAKLENPNAATHAKTTLFEYINALKRENESNGKNTGNERQILHQLQETEMQNIKLKDVNADYLAEFLGKIANGGLKASTQKNLYAILRLILNKARRGGLIPENPIYRIDKKYIPKYERKAATIHYLTIEELQTLNKCYEKETHAQRKKALQIFLLQCNTGFRISDILRLQWENIDFVKNTITIVEQKTKKLMVKTLTNGAKHYLPTQPTNGGGLVFPGIKNTRINQLLKKYDNTIGKHLHTHAARHTFATMHLQTNKDLAALKHELNHHDIKLTEIYAQVLDLTRTAEMKNLDKFASAIYK